jgi:hypothetical protein
MKSLCFALACSAVLATTALAETASTLPSTAKQLTRAEIVSLYDNKPYVWTHPAGDKGTGTTMYVAKSQTIGGTYDVGGNSGEWEGKVTWKGDQYCFRTRAKGQKKYSPTTCNLVYLDGTTAYEVNPRTKAVNSVNTPAK